MKLKTEEELAFHKALSRMGPLRTRVRKGKRWVWHKRERNQTRGGNHKAWERFIRNLQRLSSMIEEPRVKALRMAMVPRARKK